MTLHVHSSFWNFKFYCCAIIPPSSNGKPHRRRWTRIMSSCRLQIGIVGHLLLLQYSFSYQLCILYPVYTSDLNYILSYSKIAIMWFIAAASMHRHSVTAETSLVISPRKPAKISWLGPEQNFPLPFSKNKSLTRYIKITEENLWNKAFWINSE